MMPHAALLLPELLENILSFMDRVDNVTNARVCRKWSGIALDLVWKEVDCIGRLLALLRPSSRNSEHIAFDRQPDSKDWARFRKYADRVLILRYCQKLQGDRSCMLNDVARTRTKLEILPNLHTLEWLSEDAKCLEQATLFMHQGVRHLITTPPPLCRKVKFPFFVDAYTRMPHIQVLDLRVRYSVRLIEEEVLELLRGLCDLKKVIFPEFYLTSTIVSALSRKKHINAIKSEIEGVQGLGEESDVNSFAPVLRRGAFPVLRNLDITARLGDVIRFMNAEFAPVNITSLYIGTYVEHKPVELHMLLVTLSRHCHLLSLLTIKLLHVSGRLKVTPSNQITFDTIRPVLSFLNLTSFEIMHKYPVNITLEEIEELASQWPSLQCLLLNEEPLVMDDFTLDLRALIPFARHCPKLCELGLFIDGTTAKIPTTQELKPFTALRVLRVGTARVHDPATIAAFLSYICPSHCKLDASLTWANYPRRELHKEVLSEVESRSAIWERVGELLPLFTRLWREERERSKALQQEIEKIRAGNAIPMDKPKANIRVDIKG